MFLNGFSGKRRRDGKRRRGLRVEADMGLISGVPARELGLFRMSCNGTQKSMVLCCVLGNTTILDQACDLQSSDLFSRQCCGSVSQGVERCSVDAPAPEAAELTPSSTSSPGRSRVTSAWYRGVARGVVTPSLSGVARRGVGVASPSLQNGFPASVTSTSSGSRLSAL